MDRERAKELLPIIQAFAEGKKVELALFDDDGTISEWSDVHFPKWLDNHIYRIKPEPKYRPFKDAEESWEEMQKHHPFGWVIDKSSHRHWAIESTGSNLTCGDNNVLIERGWITLERVFEKFTFADGTPFGKEE